MARIPAEVVVRFQPRDTLLNGKIAAGYCLTTVNGDSVENVEYGEVMATLEAAYAGQEAQLYAPLISHSVPFRDSERPLTLGFVAPYGLVRVDHVFEGCQSQEVPKLQFSGMFYF